MRRHAIVSGTIGKTFITDIGAIINALHRFLGYLVGTQLYAEIQIFRIGSRTNRFFINQSSGHLLEQIDARGARVVPYSIGRQKQLPGSREIVLHRAFRPRRTRIGRRVMIRQ